MKKNLIVILIASLLTPASGARAASPGPTKPIGLLWVGEKGEWAGLPGFELQKELQRWVENQPGLELEMNGDSSVVSAAAVEEETNRLKLMRLSTELGKASLSSKEAWESFRSESPEEKWIRPLQKLRGSLPPEQPGAAVQASFVAEAAYAWRMGQEPEMQRLLREAIAVHPEGQLAFSADTLESGLADVFQMKLDAVKESVRRQCRLNLGAGAPGDKLFANGFELSSLETLQVIPGRYFLQRQAGNGDRSPAHRVECQRAGVQNIKLPEPVSVGAGKDLKHSLRSQSAAILIRPEAGEGRVLLYSPEGIDELGTVALADTGASGNGSWKQALNRSLNAVAAKHRLAASQEIALADLMVAPGLGDSAEETSVALATTSGAVSSDRWYNNWKFWAIAGSLLAGGAAVYFMSRPSNVGERGSVTVQKP